MKAMLRAVAPRPVRSLYHYLKARVAAQAANHPSWQLVTIGVTGTNGKSTVVALIGHLFRSAGYPVGWLSTATVRVGDREWINDTKLTMPDPFYLQDRLWEMVQAGCRVAIIEVSSEGLAMHRHRGIRFDVAVFTNLAPEHIEVHGSMEAYRQAKEQLFDAVSRRPKKVIEKLPVPRVSVVNLDDPVAPAFLQYPVDHRVGFSTGGASSTDVDATLATRDINVTRAETSFTVDGDRFTLPLCGTFNASNALAALSVVETFGVPRAKSIAALASFPGVPGRIERIDAKQPFTVIVDYAPEPTSLRALYEVVPLFSPKRIIHVFGSAGGGRDHWRRPVMGEIVGSKADAAIVTNEDPYDEDPQQIIDAVAEGVAKAGRLREGEVFFKILDRREAIRKALSLAQVGDLVLVTGKACEPWMMGPKGSRTAWDDRKVVQEEIESIKRNG